MAKIEFKTPFDDDTHTFSDGVLQRCFRMRKWMFANTFLLFAFSKDWLNFERVASAVALDTLSRDWVHAALTASGVYLVVQFAIVAYQLWVAYQESLTGRVGEFQSDDERYWRRRLTEIEQKREDLKKIIDEIRRAVGANNANRTGDIREQELDALNKEYGEVEEKLAKATDAHDSAKRQIRGSELVIDLVRVVPGPVILAFAVACYGSLSGLVP